jgi:hypothetical protein
MSNSASRHVLCIIQVLSAGTITAKEILGTLRGVIKQMPSEDPERLPDGIIAYEQDGQQREVAFGVQDINEYVSTLVVNDQVRLHNAPPIRVNLSSLYVPREGKCAWFKVFYAQNV